MSSRSIGGDVEPAPSTRCRAALSAAMLSLAPSAPMSSRSVSGDVEPCSFYPMSSPAPSAVMSSRSISVFVEPCSFYPDFEPYASRFWTLCDRFVNEPAKTRRQRTKRYKAAHGSTPLPSATSVTSETPSLSLLSPDFRRWNLSTGTCVEDIVSLHAGDLSSAFIIDLNDASLKSRFSDAEWSEISARLPDSPPERVFPVFDSVDKLRAEGCVLVASQDTLDYWLGKICLHLESLYRTGTVPCRGGERAFDVTWCVFIDSLLRELDYDVTRGEVESASIKHMLNNGRTLDSRMQGGPKFDAIIGQRNSRLEYGFLEVSRTTTNDHGSKLLSDSAKVALAMRSAIVWASHLLEQESDFRSHEVVGFMTSERQLRTMRMVYADGMCMLLKRCGPVELPTQFRSASDGQQLCELLKMVGEAADICARNKLAPALNTGWSDLSAPFRLPW